MAKKMERVGLLCLIAALVGCGESAERFGAADDVLVNDPSVDRGNNTTQSETAVARHGDVVVIGFNDSGEFSRRNSMTGSLNVTSPSVFVDFATPTYERARASSARVAK